ncbi:MAG TPA: hypothetical protein VKD90_15540 [Gemmataceae bacterium]|nr:hypothetical protein [Gemmataceae bacterium]
MVGGQRGNADGGVYAGPPADPAAERSSRTGRAITAIAVTMGVLLLIGIGIAATVVILSKRQPARPSRARSRRRYDDDDDY